METTSLLSFLDFNGSEYKFRVKVFNTDTITG